ncbi:hypothetical protein ACH4VM_39465 [Streptomyces sp. NPDC020792]|uniref:hypothetical protein n=1 Tax=Streptomyces sp. NPDC020792 TaxID=3365089 RepID=UPI0037AC128B
MLATTGRARALGWYEGLAALGVEGLICRGLATRYRPGDTRATWRKIRHADTVDAHVLGITGPVRRPYAVLLQLPDGRHTFSPHLDALRARQVADALGAGPPPAPPDQEGVRRLQEPLQAEVRLASGRHATVRFERLKADQS